MIKSTDSGAKEAAALKQFGCQRSCGARVAEGPLRKSQKDWLTDTAEKEGESQHHYMMLALSLPGGGVTIARHVLHLVTEGKRQFEAAQKRIEAALRGGVDWIQLREKTAPALDLYMFAQQITAHISGDQQPGLIINDRVDVAKALSADGVHLARKSLPADVVRTMLPRGGHHVGVSVHNLAEAKAAEKDGADYVTFGHIFPSSSKPGLPHKGIDPLRQMVEQLSIPVLAIGGVDEKNVSSVLQTGCAGIAVISAIQAADDVERAAYLLKDAMEQAVYQPKIKFPERKIKHAASGK